MIIWFACLIFFVANLPLKAYEQVSLDNPARILRQAQDERVCFCARGDASTKLSSKRPPVEAACPSKPWRSRVEPFECTNDCVGKSLLESCNYDQRYRNKAIIEKQPVGVLIVAFNRPDYLAQVIASLEQNPESQSLPFYFFLDGGPRAKQQELAALINTSTIKNKEIILRERNYGCPKNHVDSKRFMFDWCGFNKVIVLEEDLVVTPSFLRLNLALHKWAKKRFSNVGVVQCWSYCYLSREEKQKKLDAVFNADSWWWSFVGYCLDKEVWDKMKGMLYEYESFVDQIPHTEEFSKQRSKPGTSFMAPEISAWAQSLIAKRTLMQKTPGKRLFPTNVDRYIKERFRRNRFIPSQDLTTGFCLWIAGYIKIRTVVNRARHIGEIGITVDKERFDEVYDQIKLDDFSHEDDALRYFSILRNVPTAHDTH